MKLGNKNTSDSFKLGNKSLSTNLLGNKHKSKSNTQKYDFGHQENEIIKKGNLEK